MTDMRHYLDLVDTPFETAKPKFEFISSLLEGRSDQYEGMFAMLQPLVDLAPDEARTLSSYMNQALAFGRNDRIVWALTQFRQIFVNAWAARHLNDEAKADRKIMRVIGRYGQPLPPIKGSSDNKHLLQTIGTHSLKIPYSKIQNYVFPISASPQDVATVLDGFEEEFKERAKGLVTQQPGDKIILSFPNGMMWMHLSRGGCSQEASAMGHCGNGTGRGGQSILSLRKFRNEVDGEKYYEPFLTFILEKDGYLGEMKGKNNDKPIPAYHPEIVALLKLPIVKGIRGGGYMPEHNFRLSDLPPAQQEELLNLKPELGGFAEMLKRQGLTDEIKARFEMEWNQIFDVGSAKIIDAKTIKYDVCDAPEQFADFFGDRSFKAWANSLWGDNSGDDFYNVDDSALETVFDDLPAYVQKAVIAKIQSHAPAQEEDDEGDDHDDSFEDAIDFDDTSADNIVKLAQEYEPELYDALRMAAEDGQRFGKELAAARAIEKAITDVNLRWGHLALKEGETFVLMTPEEAGEILQYVNADDGETIYGNLRDLIDYTTEDYPIPLDISPSGYDRAGATQAFLDGFNGELERVPTHVRLGSRKDLMIAIDDLREKSEGIANLGLRYSPDADADTLRKIFDRGFKRYYGKPYEAKTLTPA